MVTSSPCFLKKPCFSENLITSTIPAEPDETKWIGHSSAARARWLAKTRIKKTPPKIPLQPMSLLRRFLPRYWSDISPQLVQGRSFFLAAADLRTPGRYLHINSNFTGANDFTTAA